MATTTLEQQQLEAAITGLQAQRATLGDAVVAAGVSALRAKLETLQRARPAQALRQVSVLFLDVVSSTALSQNLDPEDIHAVMDGALTAFTAIVQHHRGKVLQYAGDSLLAAFGVDDVHEDDAERAVRCGLALLDEAGRQAGTVMHRLRHSGFGIRVGIHTGGVLLGGGVEDDGTIRGMTVNIAARMEQSAPVGGMRISHDTYRHVRGVFDVVPQAPIIVKGIQEPVVTYLVQHVKPRAFRVPTRGIEGVETRMIGRDAELEQLQQAFKSLYQDGRFATITVVAEAGIGKSRLLYEFGNWAEARPEQFRLFQGRATPQTQGQPYGLLRDVMAWRLQITDGDSMAVAKRKLVEAVVPLFEPGDGAEMAEAHAHLLGQLIGLDFGESRHVHGILEDPRQIRNRGFHAAAQMFRRISAAGGLPIVLQLEDLHWADDASLDFFVYLAQINRDVPTLVLGLTRPVLFERRGDRERGAGTYQRIELRPLDKGMSRRLAAELLKKLPNTPSALPELVTAGAEGNPYYMEELVKMLADQGAIETHGAASEHWTLHPEKLLATRLPTTLTGVIQARLDELPRPERLALQQASVVGLVFWDQSLAALDPSALQALPALCRRGLIRLQPDARLEGAREYAFQHQILHHVTYETLLRHDRRELHARAAHWLAGLTSARAGDFLGPTAEHYEQAGDTARACEFYARAAERAGARNAHDAAWSFAARALALLDGDGAPAAEVEPTEPSARRDRLTLRWRLSAVREVALNLQGRRPEQRAELDALQLLADALDSDGLRAWVARLRSGLALRTADFKAMAMHAREAMELSRHAGDDELRLNGQRLLAYALVRLDDSSAALALGLDGLAQARARGLRRIEGLFLGVLALSTGRERGPLEGLRLDEQGLAIWRELGDRGVEAISLGNIGGGWWDIGQLTLAQRHLEEGLKLSRAVGDRAMECSPLVRLSTLALWRGEGELALAHARAALDVSVAVQAADFEAMAWCCIGEAEFSLGRPAAAAEAFDRSASVARSIGEPTAHDATAGSARVALALDDVTTATQIANDLLLHRDGRGTWEGTERARLIGLTCYRVLALTGDRRAAALLSDLHDGLQAEAMTLADPELRDGFLRNIPEHRAIEAAWASLCATPEA